MKLIKSKIKKLIKFIILWTFKDEITSIGLDYHINSPSWCVVNIKGITEDRVTFIQLKNNLTIKDINTLVNNIKSYSHINIDCNPNFKQYFYETN